MAWRRGGLARLMVEGVSGEVGSLGEESNAEEGKRVPREREWNQYVEAQVCASPVPHACFGVGPGRPNTRVSTRRGWIKAAVSCLLSLPPSLLLALRVQPSRPHTRVRPRIYAEFDGIECYWNFFSCLPPRNKQFAQISREIIVAGLFPIPRRERVG